MQMMRKLMVVSLLTLSVVMTHATATGAPLPQDHEYQVALRDWLATLTEEDLALEREPVTFVEDAFTDLDTWGRYWVLVIEGGPRNKGLRMPAAPFMLEAIEAGDEVNMSPGFAQPLHTAWWAQWDYPGNPYYQSEVVKRRALVNAAVDMMMLDQAHANGNHRRSDFLGGAMIRFAYAFYVGQDILPEAARNAYRDGLIRMFEKLERMTPHGSGGSDMEFFQLVSMWYAGQALGSDFPQRALDRAHVVIDRVTSDTGYELHGGAFDVSYQGIALRFLTWAALLYEDPKINEALHKMLVLKSHLTLPEPHGRLIGPTHFSTGTSMDAPHDQWAWVSRDAAMAMIDDEAMFTIWARIGVPEPEALQERVRNRLSGIGAPGLAEDAEAGTWGEDHWERTINYAFDNYHPGFYQRVRELDDADAPITRTPFGRDETFIRDLNDGGEFLAARFEDYGAIIHTGAIARRWSSGVSGKSGGSLSAFWTPERGSAVLGRTRATQGNQSDEWTDENHRGPYTWAVHTITGRGTDGHYFSASRIRDIESEYQIEGDQRAVVTVSGDLAGSDTADPQDQLAGTADYQREFRLDPDGLTIDSGVTFENADEVEELWEIIPVFLGQGNNAGEITFHVNDEWQVADEEVVTADRVRLSRYDTHVDIVFEQPRAVRLSTAESDQSFSRAKVMRNVMIALTADNDHQISYRIVPAE